MLTDDEVGKILSVRSFTHAIARGDRYTRTHTYTHGATQSHMATNTYSKINGGFPGAKTLFRVTLAQWEGKDGIMKRKRDGMQGGRGGKTRAPSYTCSALAWCCGCVAA